MENDVVAAVDSEAATYAEVMVALTAKLRPITVSFRRTTPPSAPVEDTHHGSSSPTETATPAKKKLCRFCGEPVRGEDGGRFCEGCGRELN